MKKHIAMLLAMLIMISSLLGISSSAAETRAVLVNEQSDAHDTRATAQTLEQDNTLRGYIKSASEEDYYVITFPFAGKVNFWLGEIPTGCDYDLYLYTESGRLASKSDNTNATQELISGYTVSAGLKYYLLVKSKSGYSTSKPYKLRAKWSPRSGFTYFYNKNPTGDVGSFSIAGIGGLTTKPNEANTYYNVVDDIKANGCFVTSYAMVLANLQKKTSSRQNDPRTGTYYNLSPDPVTVTFANMGFPSISESNNTTQVNYIGQPVYINSASQIASYFGASYTRYSLLNMSDAQKKVALTYYLTLHPEGIIARFDNGGSHTLVVTGSTKEISQSDINDMLRKVSIASSRNEPYRIASVVDISLQRYLPNSGKITNSNDGDKFTVYDPAYYGSSTDGSLLLSLTWTAQEYAWSDLSYIEVFN